MDSNWKRIYQSYNMNEVSIVEAFLKDNGIEVAIINKQVSMYPNLDSSNPIDVFVPKEAEAKAIELIKDNKL